MCKINKNIYFLAVLLLCLGAVACRSGPTEKKSAGESANAPATADNGTMQRLILDYTEMREDDIVSWVWKDAGFSPEKYGPVRMAPVLNYSGYEYPKAQKRIEKKLAEALSSRSAGLTEGAALTLTAAITGMRGKPGLLKRFSPSYEDSPSIELEIIISDTATGRPLVKLCHMARADEFDQALDKLLGDIELFLSRKM